METAENKIALDLIYGEAMLAQFIPDPFTGKLVIKLLNLTTIGQTFMGSTSGICRGNAACSEH